VGLGVALGFVSGRASATGTVVAAVGAQSTDQLMKAVLSGNGQYNLSARSSASVVVPADSSCLSATYGASASTGVVAAPSNADAGRDALRESTSGMYPDPTTDAGKGCVDIARSDTPPREIGADGDNASFEYYGYALDAVTWATTSLHAPPALSPGQLQGIYNCTDTDWSQVGGSSGPIQRVLPPDGSGVLNDFLTSDLGVASVSALPVTEPGCPAIERIGEDQAYDLFNGSAVYGPLGDAAQYPNAILPVSAGQWTYQSAHATNPTVDLRGGARPGQLIVPQGTGTAAAVAVTWTGSNWQLDTSTVVGDTTQVRSVSDVIFRLHGPTVSAGVGTFQTGDVGKVLDSAYTADGNVITSVSPDGSSATITPGAQATAIANAAIGYPIVSEQSVAADGANGSFPGVHYVYNVIDHTEPSYNAALALVGFQDSAGGTQSSLCNGGHANDILDAGFVPLAAQTSPGGNAGVTCRLSVPPPATPSPITGWGSTLAALPMQQWTNAAQSSGLSVSYLASESSTGLVGFANNQNDFASSEIEYSELSDPTVANTRGYQYVPDFGYGIGIGFDVNDTNGNPVTTLHLSPRTLAGIFTGTITNWSDAAITADNNGAALPNQPIRIAYRSGQTGSTSILYDYIAHVAPDLYTTWASNNNLPTTHRFDSLDGIPNPGYTSVPLQSDDQVSQYLTSVSGLWSIGFTEPFYEHQYGVTVASIQNKSGAWTQPDANSVTAALRGSALNSDLSENLTGTYGSNDPTAYPISAYSYLVTQCAASGPNCRGTYTNPGVASALITFLRYIACAGQANLSTIGYAPIPGNLSQTVANAIGQLQGTAPETLTANNCANPSF
jgi:phosphate transport system substrate-binding protein